MSQGIINRLGEVIQQLRGQGSSATTVELSGSTVTETIIVNKVQIRDAVAHYFPGNYSNASDGLLNALSDPNSNEMTIHVSNTLDQSITIKPIIATKTGGLDARYGFSATPITIAAGAKKRITSADIPELNKPFSRITFEVVASVLPTTGDLLAIVEVSV